VRTSATHSEHARVVHTREAKGYASARSEIRIPAMRQKKNGGVLSEQTPRMEETGPGRQRVAAGWRLTIPSQRLKRSLVVGIGYVRAVPPRVARAGGASGRPRPSASLAWCPPRAQATQDAALLVALVRAMPPAHATPAVRWPPLGGARRCSRPPNRPGEDSHPGDNDGCPPPLQRPGAPVPPARGLGTSLNAVGGVPRRPNGCRPISADCQSGGGNGRWRRKGQ